MLDFDTKTGYPPSMHIEKARENQEEMARRTLEDLAKLKGTAKQLPSQAKVPTTSTGAKL
jgi:hypothetical protein